MTESKADAPMLKIFAVQALVCFWGVATLVVFQWGYKREIEILGGSQWVQFWSQPVLLYLLSFCCCLFCGSFAFSLPSRNAVLLFSIVLITLVGSLSIILFMVTYRSSVFSLTLGAASGLAGPLFAYSQLRPKPRGYDVLPTRAGEPGQR